LAPIAVPKAETYSVESKPAVESKPPVTTPVKPEAPKVESHPANVAPEAKSEPFQPQEPSSKTPSEEGYVYHATNQDRAADIAREGLKISKPHEYTDQATWPDGATEKRNYFTKNAGRAWQFAPEEGIGAFLRTKHDAQF